MRCVASLPAMGSRTVWRAAALGLAVVLAGVGGCSDLEASGEGGGRETGWQSIRLPTVTRDAAFDASVYAMRQWFPVAEVLQADGVIRSTAEEFDQKGGTGRIRDGAIGYQNRMRRTATLLVREHGAGSLVKCRVRVERLDTEDHRVFRSNEEFGDVPSQTPIDHAAGVSPRQDQVWTPMPRDRGLEREMLDLVRSRATGEGKE
ncbi:MAG: hypothetical protein JXQ75_08640 [Phycisphaerae bacterium]|nr:hypothetical protein [Phycisphaerae bacterium]